MIKVSVYNQQGKRIDEKELISEIFDIEIKPGLIQQAVIAQMAGTRKAIAHVKTRGEVRGGGKKPWRQKGTGRARAGSIRSPIWRGGGKVFGPRKERVFVKKINQKAKQKALRMVFTDKVKNKLLILLDKLEIIKGKTKEMLQIVKKLIEGEILKKDKERKKSKNWLLIALPKKEEKIIRASRNLFGVQTIAVNALNIIDLVKYKYFLTTLEGIKDIEEKYKKKIKK